jgi:membrane protein
MLVPDAILKTDARTPGGSTVTRPHHWRPPVIRAKAMLRRTIAFLRPTFRYWMQTEVHVYGFSIAANVLLSFYPFLIVMLSICRNVLHWDAAVAAIYVAVDDYFPEQLADFFRRNLQTPKRIEWVSILLLLFAANGVFEPLEVALNRAWGIKTNRSFLHNQLVSYGLIFTCGTLGLLSATATALNQEWLRAARWVPIPDVLTTIAFKGAAIPLSILMLFLVYWLLPNGKMPAGRILPAAIGVGLLLEALKWINLLVWPLLNAKLEREYGPFRRSVALILFSFFAAMLVMGGAEWASRPYRTRPATVPLPDPRQSDETV